MHINTRGKDMQEQELPPVKKGDRIEVRIEATGRKGDGIAKYNGYIIIIPNSKQGQEYEVQITKVYEKYAFATITEAYTL